MLAKKKSPRRARLAGLSALAAVSLASVQSAQCEPLDWPKLAQQPGALSAVQTAINMLGECKAPFEFEQHRDDDKLSVTVLCPDTGDGAGAIIVEFEYLGGKHFFARAFKFAG